VAEARRQQIPVIPRAEMLAELMRLKYGIAVGGAHGKTTTTGLLAEVLGRAGLDPTVVIGGRFGQFGSGAKLGRGDLMIAEADESDGSFLKMKPTIAVVTNIDREHLDHYRGLGEIQDAFVGFLSRVPFYGAAVVCLDDPNVRAILPRIDRKLITYGLSSEANVRATDVAVLELDVAPTRIRTALRSFPGVHRRFEQRGEAFGATVIDDYAHHPTEIEATLGAAREGFGARTFAVFQPHRHSRTAALIEEFGRAFFLADHVVVTEIYAAGEQPVPGVDGRAVADALVRHGHPSVSFVPRLRSVATHLRPRLAPGDLVLTLGAGDVWKAAEQLVKASTQARAARGRRSKR
jgi:UDP-N-acetylmuramate--alanine ligase